MKLNPHPERTILLSSSTAAGILAFAIVLMLSAGALLMLRSEGGLAFDARLAQAQAGVAAASRIQADITEAMASVRHQLLEPKDEPRFVFQALRGRLAADWRNVEQKTAGHAESEKGVRELRALVDRQFERCESALKTGREHGAVAGLANLEASDSSRAMEEIVRTIALLQRLEFERLSGDPASEGGRSQDHRAFAGIMVVAVVIGAVACWFLVRRMQELEGLITVCAWTRRVRWEGRWLTFEEYLVKRFNLRCTHGISDEAAAQLRTEKLGPALGAGDVAGAQEPLISPARVSGI